MNATRTLSSIGLLCLSLWLCAVVAAGLSASVVFTTLPPLEPEIKGYDIPDIEMRGRLVSGLVTEPVFQIADWSQLVLCPLLLIVIMLQAFNRSIRQGTLAQWIRLIAIGLASLLFLGRFLLVNPPMAEYLDSYRAAAQAGDIDSAKAQQIAFDGWHHTAERLWGLTGVCLVIAIGATGATLMPGVRQKA
ncbi:MAG: hypothetical protein P8M22_10535 [Phycisphaerales bacterium]|nr:hypothetical protein [Phycisphaerales bacterium]